VMAISKGHTATCDPRRAQVLCSEFDPGSVEMVGFELPFRRGGVGKQDLEHTSRNANDALIFAHADAELGGNPIGVPPSVWRKAEERETPGEFC